MNKKTPGSIRPLIAVVCWIIGLLILVVAIFWGNPDWEYSRLFTIIGVIVFSFGFGVLGIKSKGRGCVLALVFYITIFALYFINHAYC